MWVFSTPTSNILNQNYLYVMQPRKKVFTFYLYSVLHVFEDRYNDKQSIGKLPATKISLSGKGSGRM